MTLFTRLMMAAWAVTTMPLPALACPMCESEIGQQVRAGIFDDTFGKKLVLTLLPFPILIALVAFIHYGPPTLRRTRPDSTGSEDPRPSHEPG